MNTTTDDTTEPKFRTISLSNRNPIAIIEAEWPEIAGDGFDVKEPLRHAKGWVKVRQHGDGRTLVYGGVSLGTRVPDERGYLHRGGEVLTAHINPAAAVTRLVDELVRLSGQERLRAVGRITLAKLPAEVL